MKHRVIISLLLVLVLYPLCSMGNGEVFSQPKAEDGMLDLRDWDFEKKGSIRLEGDWLFSWKEHIDPRAADFDSTVKTMSVMPVPGYWNNFEVGGEEIPGTGYATYYLRILLPEIEERTAINLRNIQTAYTLYLNGRETARVGVAGKSKQTTVPDYTQVVASCSPENGIIDILIHVSNYDHRKGGLWDAIRFGLNKDITRNYENRLIINIFIASCIFVMAIYHLSLFIYRRKDLAAHYFGIFCLAISLRALVTSELALFQILPGVPWIVFLKIEYITFYMGLPFFLLYLASLFPKIFSRRILKFFIITGTIFSVFVLFTPGRIFSETVQPYQFITILGGIYTIYILARSIVDKKRGSILLLAGFIIMFLTVINDILYTNQVIATGFFMPLGLLVFLLTQALLLARRTGYMFNKIETQTVELKKTNLILNSEIHERKKLEEDLIKSYKQVEKSREGIILGLAKLAEYRDEDTGSHLERIREYCRVLTKALSEHPDYENYISSEYIKDIYKSSILHDIGKVGVPDNILLKPGKLNNDEFLAIKRHPKIGGDSIRNVEQTMHIQSFLTLGKEIAYYHHEKWDGSGYPSGLSGKDIPLSARIVALADVYDALSSERPYKKAFTESETVEIISEGRGFHFDPDIVDTFLNVRNEFLRIRDAYEDG